MLLFLAVHPLPVGSQVPFQMPAPGAATADSSYALDATPVETFDPLARATQLAQELPRSWRGTYQSFGAATALPVDLQLTSLVPVGQMVVLRGSLTLAGVTAQVQGNLNAKSDQLDLLLLGSQPMEALEPGGDFQGLQGLQLSGWNAPRLTSPGGRLHLDPSGPGGSGATQPTVRGLW